MSDRNDKTAAKKAACAVLVIGGGVLNMGQSKDHAPPPAQVFQPAAAAAGDGTAITLAVSGMTCGSCEGRIRDALEARPGVRQVAVDLGSGTVRVVYDPAAQDPKALAEVVTAAGYPARYLPPGTAQPIAPRSRSGCGGGCCASQG